MIHAFFVGVILSFGLIIPLGLQNIFIFNQGAVQRHFFYAFPSVLAAFVCDTVLIILAVLGVSIVVLSISWIKIAIFFFGFLFLLYMSFVTWHAKPTNLPVGSKRLSAKQQVVFAATVSLLNPHALLDTVGVIGTTSLNFSGSAKWAYTIGCILVSFFWFLGLSMAGHTLHKVDKTGKSLIFVNKLSALIMVGMAFYIGLQLFAEINASKLG